MNKFPMLLAGAGLRDRLLACAGAFAGVAVTGAIGAAVLPVAALPYLVAPMGASAVLVFAVPASPMAQPWPVVGGNVVSAIVGVAIAQLVPSIAFAAALAVAAAILAMSLLRCLHPPGGATALFAVIGGPAVMQAGYAFALLPVGINALVLAGAGWLFHRAAGHSYPHRAEPGPPSDHPEDLTRALDELDTPLDVDRADLEQLFARVRHHAAARRTRGVAGESRAP